MLQTFAAFVPLFFFCAAPVKELRLVAVWVLQTTAIGEIIWLQPQSVPRCSCCSKANNQKVIWTWVPLWLCKTKSSYIYNCIKPNARWSSGESTALRFNKAWLSFQELGKEWKLFFNYWTASGREHSKPQYLELWSADTHMHLGAFQEGELDWGTPVETMPEKLKFSSDRQLNVLLFSVHKCVVRL